MWICRRGIRVARNGAEVLLKPGEEIPEAAFWVNRDYWVRRGFVQEISRPSPSNSVTIKVVNPASKKIVAMTLTGSEPESSSDKSNKRGGKKRNDMELPIS